MAPRARRARGGLAGRDGRGGGRGPAAGGPAPARRGARPRRHGRHRGCPRCWLGWRRQAQRRRRLCPAPKPRPDRACAAAHVAAAPAGVTAGPGPGPAARPGPRSAAAAQGAACPAAAARGVTPDRMGGVGRRIITVYATARCACGRWGGGPQASWLPAGHGDDGRRVQFGRRQRAAKEQNVRLCGWRQGGERDEAGHDGHAVPAAYRDGASSSGPSRWASKGTTRQAPKMDVSSGRPDPRPRAAHRLCCSPKLRHSVSVSKRSRGMNLAMPSGSVTCLRRPPAPSQRGSGATMAPRPLRGGCTGTQSGRLITAGVTRECIGHAAPSPPRDAPR
jgi:hypothetical protein